MRKKERDCERQKWKERVSERERTKEKEEGEGKRGYLVKVTERREEENKQRTQREGKKVKWRQKRRKG